MGEGIMLTHAPTHERLERLTLLGEWHLHAGQKAQARQYFEPLHQWRPESLEAQELAKEAAIESAPAQS